MRVQSFTQLPGLALCARLALVEDLILHIKPKGYFWVSLFILILPAIQLDFPILDSIIFGLLAGWHAKVQRSVVNVTLLPIAELFTTTARKLLHHTSKAFKLATTCCFMYMFALTSIQCVTEIAGYVRTDTLSQD